MSRATKKQRRARPAAGLFDELIVDNFAGGGGASMGIEIAVGRAADIAINHDPVAVAMHRANHPNTRHLCEDVWAVNPLEATGGRPVGLAWFSPDCKHFSRAKGGKPVEKKIRGLAWVVIKWAKSVRPRVVVLENVREFETWGPLTADSSPCPIRKGLTFRRWVAQLRNLGYAVEWTVLDAADFGAPTHRRRLFLVARCDGQPIRWPEPTHGPGRKQPWRTAAECIDWTLPCPSIFDRRRPLAEKTMRRIALGLKRFVLDNPKPFIVTCNHSGPEFRGQGVETPMKTVTGARDAHGLVVPYVARCAHGDDSRAGKRWGSGEHSAGEPLPTLTGSKDFALATPYLTRICQNGSNGGKVSPPNAPLSTVVSKNEHCLVTPCLTKYHGLKGNEARGSRADEPLNTLDTQNRFGLVSAFLAKHYGGVVGHAPDRPLGTVTAVDHHSIAAAHLEVMHGNGRGANVAEPMPVNTAQGGHIAEVRAFLCKYYGTNVGQECNDPLHTVTAKHRFGLVTVAGVDYQIVDIGMRMLAPRELARAQGFPDSYVLTGSKATQVRAIGNSVCPPVAAAVVRANYLQAPAREVAS